MTQPATATQIEVGGSIEVRWIDDDPDDEALTDIVAVHLGTGAETMVASDQVELNGTEQTVVWNSTGSGSGSYRIEARTSAGGMTAVGVAPGQVQIGTASPLETGVVPAFLGGNGSHAAAAGDGSFMLGGRFRQNDPMVFDPGGASETTVFADERDLYVIAYAPDGSFGWFGRVRVEPSTATQGGALLRGMTALPGGGWLVVVDQLGSVTVDPGGPAQATFDIGSFNSRTLFVVYDAGGQVSDAFRPFGLNENDSPWQLEIQQTPSGYAATGEAAFGQVFGAGEANEVTLSEPYVYLAAWNADGSLRFANDVASTELGGYISDDTFLATGPDGITVWGSFEGSIAFGAGTASEQVLLHTGDGSESSFLARFDHDGEFLWAQVVGRGPIDSEQAEILDVAHLVDGSCRLSVLVYEGTYVFGEGTPGEQQLVVTDEQGEVHVVYSLAADGNLQWLTTIEGEPDEDAFLVELGAGRVALASRFSTEVTLFNAGTGTGSMTLFYDSEPGLGQQLLAAYDSQGSVLWALNDGGLTAGLSIREAIGVPGSAGNSILLFGDLYDGEIQLGTNSPPATVLSSPNGSTVGFRAVYDANGNF